MVHDSIGQQSSNGNPFFETYAIKDYNAGPINRSITQNSQGILFFGNNFGLLKYDGVEWDWLSLGVKEGISALSVYYDNGRIYSGSQRDFGYFEKNDLGDLRYKSLAYQLSDEEKNSFREVWHIWEIDDKIVFYAFERIFVFENDTIKSYNIEHLNTHAAALNNKIYLIDSENTLISFDGDGFTKEINHPLLSGASIKSVLPHGKNNLLIYTEDEILFYDQLTITPWLKNKKNPFVDAKIVTAIKDRTGNFIVGTMNHGLIIYSSTGEVLKNFDNTNGLRSKYVNFVFIDKFNSMWIGHNNGIARVDYNLPFTKYDENMGVLGAGHTVANYRGKLYLGTSNGLFRKPYKEENYNSNFELVKNTNGLTHHLFNYKNKLLMGHQRGIFEIEPDGNAKLIAQTDGAWKILINKKYPENLYIGSYHGIYIINTENNNKLIKLDGFNEACRVLEFDKEGFLWVTHGLKGIFRLELGIDGKSIKDVKFYGGNKVINSNYHTNVFKIDDEVIFTGNTGIFKFNHEDQEFYRYNKYDDVIDQSFHVRELEEDPLGNIYFWSREEAGLISKVYNGKYEKIFRPFNKIIKLVDDGIVDFCATDKNNIFLGANEGFIKYSVDKSNFKKDSFNTIIREVEIFSPKDSTIYKNYEDHQLSFQPVIPYDNNSLRFKFSAVFFTDKENIIYQYLIEGFDEEWSPWTNKTEKEYINLPEGNYKFHVKAKNIYGIESNTAVFDFKILPPWYRSRIAYFIYLLIIAGSLFTAFNFIQKKHLKEKKILEEKSEEEIIKREEQLENVSKKSEEEILDLKNEKLRSEINHKNKELATSTLHLINKNKLLSEIKQKLITSSKAKEVENYQKEVKMILSEIDKNIEHDTDWEQFEFHFDLVHGDFSSRIRQAYPTLSPQDMKIAAYLRMNLSTKEIAQLLNISLRGVEKARYRLRKKLELERQVNLTEYILNF